MINWYKIAQMQTIGPLYHGTPHSFEKNTLKPNSEGVIFFSDDANFARDYGSQKSFEGKMDADIKVISAYITGEIFDPQNKEHIERVLPYLSNEITVYNDFGMDAKLDIERWKELISGEYTESPLFSEEDLKGKQIGDWLPDNEVYDKPKKYEILKLTPDKVYYTSIGTISSVMSGQYSFPWREEKIDSSKEEIADDIINLDRIAFMRKYKDMRRNHSFHIQWASRKPQTTYNNDVWRWLEGEGVFEAIKQAGFNVVKSREGRKTTYAVFQTAEIKII